jgi:flagellar protein FlaJ
VKASKPESGGDEISRRLDEIKRLETMREEEIKEEIKLKEDEKKWEERVELKRPASERLSELFYGILKKPAQRLVGSLRGLGEDLYRANMKIEPEKYVALMIGVSAIVSIFAVAFMFLMRMSVIICIMGGLISFVFVFMMAKSQPGRKAKARSVDVNRLLPYALRHMGTQLTSGIGLPESMVSVSRAGYGALSEEFGRMINDMNAGMSMEEALSAMDMRVNSEAMRRGIRQIQRTLRTGGDLSRTLNVLADESAFEMRMKLKDYVQALNMMTMMYMFISSVIPAMLMVVIMISSSGGKGGFSTTTAGVLYLFILPFLLFYFIFMIKRFEPKL